MEILIIDGQGGRLGKLLVEALKKERPEQRITAIGTNSIATAAMLRAGADAGATGENPVVVCAPRADVILGPIGILAANALLGEVTPRMAEAVSSCRAKKILLPLNRCEISVVGTQGLSPADAVREAAAQTLSLLTENGNGGECV